MAGLMELRVSRLDGTEDSPVANEAQTQLVTVISKTLLRVK
jgi:hypothetical protein